MEDKKSIRYGMIGGGIGSTIGVFHRAALARIEGTILSAGCFTRNIEKNYQTGMKYGVSGERIYNTYLEMAEKECGREDRIDFVVICTPNATHYEIAKTFLEHGIPVACEKPLCFTVEQGEELKNLAEKKNLPFVVTYTYSGCEMTLLAKKLVAEGAIGDILNVNATYFQGWMLNTIKARKTGESSTLWRTLPEYGGISNCVGDVGTHIENTVARITGLHPVRVAAVLDTFGENLDVNANILVQYENNVHGVYSCSQIYVGQKVGLEIRISGTEGTIEWAYRDASHLTVSKNGQEAKVYTSVCQADNAIPNAEVILAFANIYRNFIDVLKKSNSGKGENERAEFPNIEDGIAGVKFINAVVNSSRNHAVWMDV